MNKLILIVVLVSSAAYARGHRSGVASYGGGKGSQTRVRTYVAPNTGTYVPAHVRTSPDSTRVNNWSTVGNYNPYTGVPGTKPVIGPVVP